MKSAKLWNRLWRWCFMFFFSRKGAKPGRVCNLLHTPNLSAILYTIYEKEEKVINVGRGRIADDYNGGRGFTLIELLVVISVISLLLSILVPALGKATRRAEKIIGMSRLRHTAAAANMFAMDNNGWYPESVARIGSDENWNWADPRVLTGKGCQGGNFALLAGPELFCPVQGGLRTYPQIIQGSLFL